LLLAAAVAAVSLPMNFNLMEFAALFFAALPFARAETI